jgi:hypothetical protein
MKATSNNNGKGHVDPADYASIVGKTFVTHEHAAILRIGAQTWTRYTLGRLGCPHPIAASRLNKVVQQLDISSLSDLATRAQEIGTYEGCGVTAYWTVLAILREAGFKVEEVHGQDVTFHTMQARERKLSQQARRPSHRRRSKGAR